MQHIKLTPKNQLESHSVRWLYTRLKILKKIQHDEKLSGQDITNLKQERNNVISEIERRD